MNPHDDQPSLFDDDSFPGLDAPAAGAVPERAAETPEAASGGGKAPKRRRAGKKAGKDAEEDEEPLEREPMPLLASTPESRAASGFGGGPLHRLVDDNFLQYASYVIRDRAIPELIDGLKPVQRRILHALSEKDDGRFIKVANIVGHTMQYHPHGDASIGDALVTLVNRGYLIEGQGNFGNIYTGDPAAAPRYIECRLTDLAATQLFNKDLTEYVDSYDGRNKEPVVLPAKLPLLLMLGADGIAVGLSTRILPHNFAELLQAQIAILRRKPFRILPDFQQGGLMDAREYDDGRGRLRVRAVIDQKDESTLVIRELPYGVTTESLIASIESAAKKGKLKIRPIHDYTAASVEIEIKLAPDTKPEKALKALYAFTNCEISLSLQPMVIRDRRPVEMTVSDILRFNTERLVDLLHKELEIERRKLLEALHTASLVRLFIVKRIYKSIEECKTQEAVRAAILDGLAPYRDQLRRDISDADITMLLAIPIRRISLYDINKSKQEEDNLLADLAANEKSLADVTGYTIRYLKALLADYGKMYPRRTKETAFDAIEVRTLEERKIAIRRDRQKGYIGTDEDIGEPDFTCSSLAKLLLLWQDGRYRVVPPPEKLFVDKDLLYAGVFDRDAVCTMVYTAENATSIKKFNFGGVIQNRDYNALPAEGKILYFSPDVPEQLYVVYAPKKGQQIRQQVFATKYVRQHGVKSRGVRMTTKKIAAIGHNKPRSWDDKEAPVRGALLNFV